MPALFELPKIDPERHPQIIKLAKELFRWSVEDKEEFFAGDFRKFPSEEQREILRWVEREKCKTDLYYLATEVLGYGLMHEPLHRPLAERITTHRPGEFVGTLIPRGHYKTSLLTIAGTVFEILNNPNIRILFAHSILDLAQAMLQETKWVFHKNERFRYLFPEYAAVDPDKAFGKQDEFTTPARTRGNIREPSVRTGATDATLVSSHYDLIIFDDIVDEKNCETANGREKVYRFYERALSLLDPGGRINMIGTRWHDADVYGKIMKRKSSHWDWCVMTLKDEEGNYILPKAKVTVKDPDGQYREQWRGFDEEEERKLREEQSLGTFLAQYYNDPIDPEKAKFSSKHLQYIEIWPDVTRENVITLSTVDPAISDEDGSCYSTIVTVQYPPDANWYVVEALRERWDELELIDAIFGVVERWNPQVVGIEDVAYQKALFKPIKVMQHERVSYFPCVPLKSYRQGGKDYRISQLQPFWSSKRIYIDERLVDLEYEILRYPVAETRDLIDALAYHVELLKKPEVKKAGLPEHQGLGRLLPGCDPDRDDFEPGTWGHFRREQFLKERNSRNINRKRRIGEYGSGMIDLWGR